MFFETTLTTARIGASRGFWADRRLQEFLDEAVLEDPTRTATVDARGRLTFGELAEQTDLVASALLDLGVRPGDVVGAQLPNWNEFVVLMLAVERIGAVMNPVAPIFRMRELSGMYELARPVLTVIPDSFRGFDFPQLHAELAEATPSLREIVVIGEDQGAGTRTWDDLLDAGRRSEIDSDTLDLLAPDPNAVAELIFTSGTTGTPKGVLHTHNTLGIGTQAMIDSQSITSRDVAHMASTFAHQTGYLFGARLCVQAGITGVFQEVWDPARFVELVEQHRISLSFGAAPFLADVLGVPDLADHDLSSFRVFGCFGAAIPGPLLEQAAEKLPAQVMPGWGMSEVSLMTTTRPGDPPAKISSTDGAPLPGNEVRVVGPDGEPVPTGEEGDLECRGVFEFVGYVQGRDFTSGFYHDDWFMTGDRARLDEDGYLRITGRSKDLVIRGGENVPVKEIEDLLLRHPDVAGVAIVGKPDPRLGEIACAFVLPVEGRTPTLGELTELLAGEKVTKQFWPEALVLIEEFPTTPSGKVQKFKLRESLL